MTDVFILGAGFSKAVSDEMLTLAELSEKVKKRLIDESPLPPIFDNLGDNIETWMTFLSQGQPWLKQRQIYRNRSLAGRIRDHIGEIIEECTLKVSMHEANEWLNSLIESWHKNQATVITLNYDTLVERACRELNLTDEINEITAGQMYPPYFTNIASIPGAALFGDEPLNTFSYLKLHGSLNWYYSGSDDFYGESIYFSKVPSNSAENKSQQPPEFRHKEILLIPPVYEKSKYFNNEAIRSLWQDAGTALAKARRIFVIGYSLPVSDLGMEFFLRSNQPKPSTEIYIVDKDSNVKCRFKKLLPSLSINERFVGGNDAVKKFSQQYKKDEL